MLLTEAIPTTEIISDNERAEEQIMGNNLPEAAAILVDIVDNDPTNSRAFNNLGVIAWKQENWYDAFGLFKHSLTLQPDYADAAANLFDMALKIRRIPEVKDLLIKASQLLPHDEELEDIALGLIEDGEDIYFCGRALQQGYYHPELEYANQLVQEGELQEALKLFLKVHDEQGELAEVYNGLGVINFYQGNVRDAFTLFLEAIKLNPINRDMFLNLFDSAVEIDERDSALQVFYTCKKEYPQLAEIEELLLSIEKN